MLSIREKKSILTTGLLLIPRAARDKALGLWERDFDKKKMKKKVR